MATTPDAADLTTVAALKSYLGDISSPDEVLLQGFVTGASMLFQTVLSKPIHPVQVVAPFSGRGINRVFLPVGPVQSITSVQAGTAIYGPATPGGTDVGYFLDGQALELRGAVFPVGVRNVVVTYMAGYGVRGDIAQAVLDIAAAKWRGGRNGAGLSSRSMGGESLSFTKDDLPPGAKLLLEQLRNVVPS